MANIGVGSNAPILEVLDRSNYKHWRSRLETYFKVEDIWGIAAEPPQKLDDDDPVYKAWDKKNVRALYAIQNTCGREMFSYISELKTAYEAWTTLEKEVYRVGRDFGHSDEDVDLYEAFMESIKYNGWDRAKRCLGDIDVQSVLGMIIRNHEETALDVAVKAGRSDIVKEMVSLMSEYELDFISSFGKSALHLAVEKGHKDVVKELVSMGGSKDEDGNTALQKALQLGKVDIALELVYLMKREDLIIQNDDGDTALHIAVKYGHAEFVRCFVLGGIEVKVRLEIQNDRGDTALHTAVKEGKVGMVKLLVYHMIIYSEEALKVKNKDGFTALHLAIRMGNMDVVKKFVKKMRGADDDESYGQLVSAARNGQLDLIKERLLLLKTREEESELRTTQDFIAFGCGLELDLSEGALMEKAKYMVEQYQKKLCIILEMKYARKYTPLHFAVMGEHMDIVKELAPLMRPEGFELASSENETALQIAALLGNVEIVEELLRLMSHKSLEIQGDRGRTALHMAVYNGDIALVKKLASSMRQEGLEAKDEDGEDALQAAISLGKMNIAKVLFPLMRNSAMKHKNLKGYTALACAFNGCNDEDLMEIVKYMAENNSEVLGQPMRPDNEIPVVRAIRLRKWELARYLYSVTPIEALKGPHGSSLICYCLDNNRGIDLALNLLQRYPRLAYTMNATLAGGTPIMQLAQLHFVFLSGTPLTWWQRWLYDCIHIGEVNCPKIDHMSIDVIATNDDHSTKINYNSSVWSSCRRFFNSLYIFCGIQRVYDMKSIHEWIFQSLHCIGEEMTKNTPSQNEQTSVRESILKAIELRHFEFVAQLCKVHPELLLDTYDEKKKSIFHFAIENRLEEVYNLIYELEEERRHSLSYRVVDHGDTLLYAAANLSSVPQFDSIQDASLQMQNELQWFKEVESVVPLEMHERRNTLDGLTARELFAKTHKKLLDDAETSTKGTAASCTVVGALIVTMMFAAAFTVPGGNDGDTGLPLMLDHELFKVFIVSDTISLVSSTTSVITFLGILTSRFAQEDFLKSLPTKMMLALFTLFISIATMMIAFSCALVLMLHGEATLVIPSIVFATFPAIVFVWLLFPLLGKIFKSTYGAGRFIKRQKAKV